MHVNSGRYPLYNSLDIYFQERVLIPSLLRLKESSPSKAKQEALFYIVIMMCK